MLIQEKILWNPNGTVNEHNADSDHESGDEDGSDGCEEDDEDAKADEAE